jgi:multisubunit Na+/H+ antiporter MnhE subunit
MVIVAVFRPHIGALPTLLDRHVRLLLQNPAVIVRLTEAHSHAANCLWTPTTDGHPLVLPIEWELSGEEGIWHMVLAKAV